MTVTLDPSAGGGDLLQIRSTLPGIVVSVQLPTGQVINQANASSYSYRWETFDSAQLDPAASGSIGSPAPGRHELIRLPAGQPAGAYRILAVRGTAAGPAGVLVRFESLSGVRFGVSARGQFHSPNQPVTLAAVLMANETAVANASVSGTAHVLVANPTGVALGGWQLRSKVDQGDGTSHYFYGATLQNSGSAFVDFRAKPSTDDDAVHFDTDEMMFRGVAQGEAKPCNLCLGFVGPTSPEPSPASFAWKLYADAPAVPVTLSDSTPEYPATGDGVYTGTFTSPYAGEHWIDLKAEGVGPNQRSFVRVAGVTVRVEPRPAYFLGFSDAAHDTDADGIPDEVRVIASIHVDEPGTYSFSMHWKDSEGNIQTTGGHGELNTGTQQLTGYLPEGILTSGFAADGPYTRFNASLALQRPGETVQADFLEDAGVSQPYVLADFSAGILRLSGSPTFTAVNTGGGPAYDLLRVTVPVISPGAKSCAIEASLGDQSGLRIAEIDLTVNLVEGSNVIALEFLGPVIARRGLDGPFAVADLNMDCGSYQLRERRFGESEILLASAFEDAPQDFLIQIPALGISRGETRPFIVRVEASNGFDEVVTLTASGLPAGVSAVFATAIQGKGVAQLLVSADAGTVVGTHSINIMAVSTSISKTIVVPLVVSDGVTTVTVSPTTNLLHPGMSRQMAVTVSNSPSQVVTWSLASPALGSIGTEGVYLAPATIGERLGDLIVATSIADPSRNGVAAVVLLPPVVITLEPVTTSLRAGESTWIYASLEHNGNTYNPSLTWTSVGPTGSLSKLPLSARYTAPATITAPQTVTIRATFAEDPAALAEVVLTLVPTIQVSLAPTMATLRPNESQAFTPTVTNDPANAGVTWQVTPQVGTVDAAGLYIAPAVIAAQSSVILRATSVSDPLRSATATITLLPALDPRMTLTAPVSDISVPVGSVREVAFTLTPVDGFAGEAALSVEGLPPGATAQILPGATSAGGPSLLRLRTEAGLAEGSYAFTLRATLPDRVVTLPLQLSVIAAPPFTVITGNPVGAVPAGSSVTFSIDVPYRAGWTGWITPSAVGLPSGATVTFAPASRSGPGIFLATVKPATGASLPRHAVEMVVKHLHAPTTLRSTHVLLMPDAEGLPAPWAHTGVAVAPQAVRHQSGVFTLDSAGSGIGGTADALQFVHRPTSGNFTLVARVSGTQSTAAGSKVGLLVRDGFAGNERMFFLGWDNSGNLVRQHRATAGTAAVSVAGPVHTKPYWLKLVRSVNSFRSFVSADGQLWVEVGAPVPSYMAAVSYAGFAAAGGEGEDEAVFDEAQFAATAIF